MQPRIPNVTLLEEMGRGRGGVVFRALHGGRECLVKLPGVSPSGSPSAVDFEHEALLLARLGKEGLPRVLQVAAIPETPYAILERADGELLSTWLRAPSGQEVDAVELAQGLARALWQLHEAGFVHGAVVPDHIVFAERGRRVQLLDRGTLSRQIPPDVRGDIRGLGVLMQQLSTRAPGARLLSGFAEQLRSGRTADLTRVMADLEQRKRTRGRGAQSYSYPPPSHESPHADSSSLRARSEMEQLLRAFQAVRDQQGKVVEVLGPPGSGKSRMLAAFAHEVGKEDVQVLSVRCRDSDWAPFSALKRLLEGHLAGLAVLEPAQRAAIEHSLREAAGPMASLIGLLSPKLAELFHDIPTMIGEGDARQVFIDGTADFLARYLAGATLSVVIIDDLHWLDASSRKVLSRVAARVCSRGHMFVCGARDGQENQEPLEHFRAVLPPELIESIQLGALCDEDVRHLIGEYLGLERPPGHELVRQLSQLSDGTPLSLVELLRLTLEGGHLKLHWGKWQLDTAAVHRMRLPASFRALVERRVAALDQTDIDILKAAAISRRRLDEGLLANAMGLDLQHVQRAFDAALHARLIERGDGGEYRFVHDSVWEALLHGTPEQVRCDLHYRIGEALFVQGVGSIEDEYDLARHFVAGAAKRDPLRTFEITRRAAQLAIAACDDVLALSFLHAAEDAARSAGVDPGRDFYVDLAEANLRIGAVPKSLECFALALERSQAGFERAHALGRIAWIHHYESEHEASWRALERALAEAGCDLPGSTPGALGSVAVRWLANALLRWTHLGPRQKLSREHAEVLLGLYTECMRVSLEGGSPLQVVVSVLYMSLTARQLEPCRTVVYADVVSAFVLSLLGAERQSRRLFASAKQMATDLADPIAQTLCHQVGHVIAGWRGDFDESEREARACVDERGHWMELGELCHLCFAMYAIEVVRGRPESALAWTERAIERVRQSARPPAAFAIIEDAARSTLIALGREDEMVRIERRLRFVERGEIREGSYFYLLLYQSRAQQLTERDRLGDEFEELVEEFDRLGLDPKQVHLAVVVYYLHVAHARVHQLLRAAPAERVALMPKLEAAVRDVEAAARIPALRAHARVTRAAQHWFSGSARDAERCLREAEALAQEHGCPWVTYSVARLRAHVMQARGNSRAAHEQAAIAALIARENRMQRRLRHIEEEFRLADAKAERMAPEADAPGVRRQLDALLHITQASSRELGPERQARLILDELIEAVQAERALLFARGERDSSLHLRAARRAGHADLTGDPDYDSAFVERVYATGQTEVVDPGDPLPGGTRADRARAVVPLVLREQPVGVLYMERPDSAESFGPDDTALLQALASQVPLALELAEALRERERLQQNLRQAQKMEAIGRLAGGIAHDFNNILATIRMAADNLGSAVGRAGTGREEVDDIIDSARRGTELTRQLVTFSRGEVVLPRRIQLGSAIEEMVPMLRRLVRPGVQIEVEIDQTLPAMLADPTQVERILMNLCQNASDAMPHGGVISVRVAQAGAGDGDRLPVQLDSGLRYAVLTVADTGLGMDDDVRARVFEPFFTTKSERGTGLGLANVYAIVQQCNGHIEVASEPGLGTTFRIHLPLTEAIEPEVHIPFVAGDPRLEDEEVTGGETILVVDDDLTVQAEMVRILERAGYVVLSAHDGEEALQVVDAYDGLVDLAVTDVNMPRMDGPRLVRSLLSRDPDVKIIFVSGHASAELTRSGLLGREAVFLAKPFGAADLLGQIEALLGAAQVRGVGDAAED